MYRLCPTIFFLWIHLYYLSHLFYIYVKSVHYFVIFFITMIDSFFFFILSLLHIHIPSPILLLYQILIIIQSILIIILLILIIMHNHYGTPLSLLALPIYLFLHLFLYYIIDYIYPFFFNPLYQYIIFMFISHHFITYIYIHP